MFEMLESFEELHTSDVGNGYVDCIWSNTGEDLGKIDD